MPTMRTSMLTGGMVLARDALGPDGSVVLRAGAVVDDEILSILTERRVRQVEVTQDSFDRAFPGASGEKPSPSDTGMMRPPEMAKAATSIVQARLVRIAHMFAEHRDDPLMRELCRLAIKCAQERLIRA